MNKIYLLILFNILTLNLFAQDINILEDTVDNNSSVELRKILLKVTVFKCRNKNFENCINTENSTFINEARLISDKILIDIKKSKRGEQLKPNEVMLSTNSSASGYQKTNEIDFVSVTFTYNNLFKCVIQGSEFDDADVPIFQM